MLHGRAAQRLGASGCGRSQTEYLHIISLVGQEMMQPGLICLQVISLVALTDSPLHAGHLVKYGAGRERGGGSPERKDRCHPACPQQNAE